MHKRSRRLGHLDTGAQVVFVGDLINKGPKSRECIRLAREADALMVRGNHEQAVLKAVSARAKDKNYRTNSYGWTDALTDGDLDFLRSLPLTITLSHYNCIVVHAGLVPGVRLEDQNFQDMVCFFVFVLFLQGLLTVATTTLTSIQANSHVGSWTPQYCIHALTH